MNRRIYTGYVEVETSPVTSSFTNARKVGNKIFYSAPMPISTGSVVGYEGQDYIVLDKSKRMGVFILTVREKS